MFTSLFFKDFKMYKAISDRIIIKLSESEKSNLIMSDDYRCRNKGVVISTGDKVKAVKVGDYVLFHPFDEIELPEKDLAVIREKSLLAKFE